MVPVDVEEEEHEFVDTVEAQLHQSTDEDYIVN